MQASVGILACVSHISLSLPLFPPYLALSGEKMLDMAEEMGIDNRALGSVVDRSVCLRCERYGNETHIRMERLDFIPALHPCSSRVNTLQLFIPALVE